MKLYPKKLHSLSELEREKKTMKYALKQIDIEDMFSLGGLLDNSKGKNETEKNTSPLNGLLGSPLFGTIMNVVVPMLKKRSSQKEKADKNEEPHKKNIVKSAAIELIGGYLKWKAVDLSIKGIKKLLHKKKDKQD